MDFSKIRAQLPGFSPTWTLARGAAETFDAFRRAGLDLAQFESRKYTRLKQLSYLRESGNLGADLRWVNRGLRGLHG